MSSVQRLTFVDKPLSIPRLSSNVPHVLLLQIPMRSPRPLRHGVTLLELLVVLLLMALSAAIVLPALLPPATALEVPGAAALAHARRSAIRRGESLRFQLATDGVWALASLHDGNLVDSGRVVARSQGSDSVMALNVLINPLGSCLPVATDSALAMFDPLACAWRTVDTP